MANEASTLGIQRTIREYLLDKLVNKDTDANENGVQLRITVPDPAQDNEIHMTNVCNVDLLWGGQEYLIAFSYKEGESTHVHRLIEVLPLSFGATADSTQATTS